MIRATTTERVGSREGAAAHAEEARETIAHQIATMTVAKADSDGQDADPFRYCLNTSTIRGQKLSLVDEIEIAAAAGYNGIEPWIDEIDAYVAGGGSLADLDRRLRDHGLAVEGAIGFFEWIVDDDARRSRGLDEAKRNMDLLARIGGKRLAAPPWGAHSDALMEGRAPIDLLAAAERYRTLLEIGDEWGVVPQVEVWGFSRTLSRLCEAALVAVEAGHPDACILADVYHLHKGGSPVEGLRALNGTNALHVFHVNDYPADPPRETIGDGDRVFPGDGVAPLGTIFRTLRDIGFRGALSLELFNPEYYQRDAGNVARTGLEKLRAAVLHSGVSGP
jgi:sugar phosphate isomerase/epimerase